MAQINLKVAALADLEFYNKLRNDADNAEALNWQEFNPESLEMTEAFILRQKGRLLTARMDNKDIVGYVKFSILLPFGSNYKCDEIGLFVEKRFRGKGFSSKMLLLAEEMYDHSHSLVARVHSSNFASLKSFYRAGYQEAGKLPVVSLDSDGQSHIHYLVK
jgi:RimJ/RimL family protein N-acetyltransferase